MCRHRPSISLGMVREPGKEHLIKTKTLVFLDFVMFFLARQIEKSDVLPCVKMLLSYTIYQDGGHKCRAFKGKMDFLLESAATQNMQGKEPHMRLWIG